MLKREFSFPFLVLSLLIFVGLAQAEYAPVNLSYDFTAGDWQNADWTFNGDADWANDSGLSPTNRLRLTDNGTGRAGSAWLEVQIVPTESWSISLTGQFSYASYGGADGMALIFQSHGLDALPLPADFNPTSGTGLGSDYLALNLDSYQNAGEPANLMEFFTKLGTGRYDMNDGQLEGSEGNGFVYTLQATYNKGTQVLEYTLKRTGFSDAVYTRTDFDMSTRFDVVETAYVGFWAGSGGSTENHDVRSFSIEGYTVPEPATIGLLAFGAAAVFRRRRSA